MCDCFHLAFPNWHGPVTGAGRRLRGPEQETEDYSEVCEEPVEFVEGERPRPQGSSPVEDFPAAEKYLERQAEDDIFDPVHKTGSGKKAKKVGFGSLFEKRSAGKISQMEEFQDGESEVLVKTAKEACAEGLVVTGGGKDGIFIKELKPNSPASKYLQVKEGDQILSATVYFDNVSYEDALQILEHAQACKMELCLRRKPPSLASGGVDDAEVSPKADGGSPKLRGRKAKRQEARISWPKFPSFSKGRKGFKRSHSTSEAEEQRKLEMSPTTSDTESPVKSPLKSPDGKEEKKKKKKRLRLKVKMKGLRSKSVEHPTRDEEPKLESMEDGSMENQAELNETDVQSPEDMQQLCKSQHSQQGEPESEELLKLKDEYAFQNLTDDDMETVSHKTELIALDKTLKTTDISVALAEANKKDKGSPDSTKTVRAELRMNIQGKDLLDKTKQSQIQFTPGSQDDPSASIRTPDPFGPDNAEVDPNKTSHTDISDHQLIDISSQDTSPGRSKSTGHEIMDNQNVDISLDISDASVFQKSQNTGGEKPWREKSTNIPEPESYGIRTRGPLADIATSKATFDAINGLQFTSSGRGASTTVTSDSDFPSTIPNAVISQPKPSIQKLSVTDKSQDDTTDKVSEASTIPLEDNADKVLVDIGATDLKAKSDFKLPKVDVSVSNLTQSVKMTRAEDRKIQLPNREEFVIPGMEGGQGKNIPDAVETIDTKLTEEIQAKKTDVDFNLEDVKALVAKIPTFKLPRIDMSGIYTHKEITPDSDKILASPSELSEAKTDVSLKMPDDTVKAKTKSGADRDSPLVVKLPNVDLPHMDVHEPITAECVEDLKPKAKAITEELRKMAFEKKSVDLKYKLPKREDIEIPGMEAIQKTTIPSPTATGKPDKSTSTPDKKMAKGKASATDEKTDKLDKKGREKKKKTKKSKSGLGMGKPDIHFPDIGIDFPKQATSLKKGNEGKGKTEAKSPDKKPKSPSGNDHKDILIQGEKDVTHSRESRESHGEEDVSAADHKTLDERTSLPEEQRKETLQADTSMPLSSNTEMKGDEDIETQTAEMTRGTQKMDIKSSTGKSWQDVPGNDTKESDIKPKKKKKTFPKFSLSKSEVKPTELDAAIQDGNTDLPDTVVAVDQTEIEVAIPKYESHLKDKDSKEYSPTRFKFTHLKFPKFGMSPQKVPSRPTDAESEIKLPDNEVMEVVLSKDDESDLHAVDPSATESKAPLGDKICNTEKIKPPLATTEPEHEQSIKLPEVAMLSADQLINQAEIELQKETAVELQVDEAEPREEKVPDNETIQEEKRLDHTTSEEKSSDQTKLKDRGTDHPSSGLDTDVVAMDLVVETVEEMKKPDIPSEGKVDEMPTYTTDTETGLTGAEVGMTDPSIEQKEIDTKMKKKRISFPKFGFSRSDSKGSDDNAEPQKEDINVESTGTIDSEMDSKSQGNEAKSKDKSVTTSPTKFKLPTLKLPKFRSPTKQQSGVDMDSTIPEDEILKVSITENDVKISENIPAQELDISLKANVDIPRAAEEVICSVEKTEKEMREPPSMDVVLDTHKQLFEMEGNKAGVSRLEDQGVNVTFFETKGDVDIPQPEKTIDVSGVESKNIGAEIEKQSYSHPMFEISKTIDQTAEMDITAKKVETRQYNLDIEIEEGEDVSISSSSKFKLPTTDVLKTKNIQTEKAIEPAPCDIGAELLKVNVPDANLSITGEMPQVDVEEKAIDINIVNKDKTKDSGAEKQGSPFKFPKFGISIPKTKGPEKDVGANLPEEIEDMTKSQENAEITEESTNDQDQNDFDTKTKRPGFSFPKFGFSKLELKGPGSGSQDQDIPIPPAEASEDIKEQKSDADVAQEGKEGKDSKGYDIKIKRPSFSFPKFGFTKQDIKTTDTDAATTKHEAALQEGAVEITESMEDAKTADGTMEEKHPTEVDIKFKRPNFSFPKFGFSKPDTKSADTDASVPDVDIPDTVAEGELLVQVDENVSEANIEVKESKDFNVKIKRPGFSFPKFPLSKPDVEDSDINVRVVDSQDVGKEVAKEERDGVDHKETIQTSPSRFKIPTLKLPKIGLSTARESVEQPSIDENIQPSEISVLESEFKIATEIPETNLEGQEVSAGLSTDISESVEKLELEEKESKFKPPSFGISLPAVKGPEINATESKENVDNGTPLPEGKSEVPPTDSKGIDLKIRKPSFSFPKFGFSKQDAKPSDGDVNLFTVDTSLPEEEEKLKDLEIGVDKSEEGSEVKDYKGIDIKIKRPSFSFPKFGFSKTDSKAVDADASVPDIDIPDTVTEGAQPIQGDDKIPEANIEAKEPKDFTLKMKRPSFTFPKFGLSKADVEGPDIHVSVGDSQDAGKVEVKQEEYDVDHKEATQTSPSRFKIPSLKLPKIELSTAKEFDAKPIVDGNEEPSEISVPESALQIATDIPKLSFEGDGMGAVLSTDSVASEDQLDYDEKESKFKLPSFGISLPKVKGPEFQVTDSQGKEDDGTPQSEAKPEVTSGDSKSIDFKIRKPSFSFPKFGFTKQDAKPSESDADLSTVDISLPEEEGKVKDPETGVDESSEVKDIKGIDMKMKRPSFSFPKFGFSKPENKSADFDACVADVSIPDTVAEGKLQLQEDENFPDTKIEVKEPIDFSMKMKGPSFTFPKFGLSKQDVECPDMDVGDSKDAGKFEVTEKKDYVEQKETIQTSPTRFKVPSLKLPKIGLSAAKESVEVADGEVNVKPSEISVPGFEIAPDFPEMDLGVNVSLSTKDFSASAEKPGIDEKESTLKPSTPGISLTTVKGPEIQVTDSIGKENDRTLLPEEKPEVLSVDSKGIDLKIRKPSFSFPKFGFSKQDAKPSESDVELSTADTSLAEKEDTIKDQEIGIESEGGSDVKDSKDFDIKIKRPSFSFPKFGFSKPDVEASDIQVNQPKVDTSVSHGKLDIKGSNVYANISERNAGDKEKSPFSSPVKMKLPSIKLPKIGVSGAKDSVEEPSLDVDVRMQEVVLPDTEPKGEGEIPEVHLQGKGVEVTLATTSGTRECVADEKENKSKLQSFGISLPTVQGADIDVAVLKSDSKFSLPEVKADDTVQLDVTDELQGPDSKAGTFKIKRPSFSFPKFGFSKSDEKQVETAAISLKAETPERHVDPQGADIDLSTQDGTQENKDSKGAEIKIRRPSFTFPKFGFSKPDVKASDIDASLPEIDIPKQEKTDTKEQEGDAKTLKGKMEGKDMKGIDLKIKRPSFSFPKFGFSKSDIDSSDIQINASEADLTLSTEQQDVEDVDPKTTESGNVTSPSKLKLGTLTMPKFGLSVSKKSEESPSLNLDMKTSEQKVSETDTSQYIHGVGVTADEPEKDKEAQKFKLPNFGISLPTRRLPEIDVSKSTSDPSAPLPEGQVDEINLLLEDKTGLPETDSKDLKIKRPSFSFPKFGMSKPDVKGPGRDHQTSDTTQEEVDISKQDTDAKCQGDNVEVKSPKVLDLKIKRPSFSLPTFGSSKIDVEPNEMDSNILKLDASVPESKLEVKDTELDNKTLEGNVESLDVKDLDLRSKRPSFSFSLFGLSKPDAKTSDADVDTVTVDASLPDEDVEVKGLDRETKTPDRHTEGKQFKGLDLKSKRPSFSFQLFGSSKPDSKTDCDDSSRKAEMSLPDETIDAHETDLKTPEESIEGLKARDLKLKRPSFSFPLFGLSKPNAKPSDMDVDTSSVDVSEPDREVESTNVEKEVKKTPEKTLEVQEKSRRPSFTFQLFGLSKPEVKITDTDVDTPTGDVSLPGGKVETSIESGIKSPEKTIEEKDSNVLDLKSKAPSFSFSLFGLSKPDVKTSETDVETLEADMTDSDKKLEVKNLESEVSTPEKSPGGRDLIDIKKSRRPSFTLQLFGLSKPNVNISDTDVDAPNVDVAAPDRETEATGMEGEAGSPEKSVEENKLKKPDLKSKRPSFSFPLFGLSKPDVNTSDTDIKVPDVETSLPERNREAMDEENAVTTPEKYTEDKDLKVPDIKTKRPSFSFPLFGLSKPDVKTPDTDINVQNVDMSLSDEKEEATKIKSEANSQEKSSEDTDLKVIEANKSRKPSFTFQMFGLSKPEIKTPDTEIDVPGVDTSVLEGIAEPSNQESKVKTPDTSIGDKELKAPDLKPKRPSFSFPLFSMSKQDATTPDTEIEAQAIDVSVTERKTNITGTKSEVMTAEKGTEKSRRSSFTFQLFGLSKPDVKTPETDVNIPTVEFSPDGVVDAASESVVKTPEKNTEDKDLQVPDLKLKRPSFSFPLFGLSKPDVKTPDIEFETSTVDVTLPDEKTDVIETEREAKSPEKSTEKSRRPSFTFQMFGLSKPDIKTSDTDVDGASADLSVPDGKTDTTGTESGVTSPEKNSEGKDLKAIDTNKSRRPSFTFQLFGLSKPDIKTSEADVDDPTLDVSSPKGKEAALDTESESKTLEKSIEDKDLKLTDVKSKRPSFSFPLFSLSKPDVKCQMSTPGDDIDVPIDDMSLFDEKVEGTNAKSEVRTPEKSAKDKDLKVEDQNKSRRPSFTFQLFGLSKPDVKTPDTDIDVSTTDASLHEGKAGATTEEERKSKTPEKSTEDKDLKVFDQKSRPSFSFPMFSFSKPDIKISDTDVDVPEPDKKVDSTCPESEAKTPEGSAEDKDLKVTDRDKSRRPSFTFNLFGLAKPDVKPLETDVDVSSIDISLPEGKQGEKCTEKEAKSPEKGVEDKDLKAPDLKSKRPSFSFQLFGLSKSETKTIETNDDVQKAMSPAEGGEVLEAKGKEGSIDDKDTKRVDLTLKRPSFSFPSFGLSKADDKKTDNEDVSSPDGKLETIETDTKMPEISIEGKDKKRPSFSFPKFSFSKSDSRTSDSDEQVEERGARDDKVASKRESDKHITDSHFGVSLPRMETSGLPRTGCDVQSSVVSETKVEVQGKESKSEVLDISQSKFKLPSIRVSTSGSTVPTIKIEAEGSEPEGDTSTAITDSVTTVDGKVLSDTEEPSQPGDDKSVGSPIKFKLPNLRMPRLSFSKPKPEDDVESPGGEKSEEASLETGDKENTQVTDNPPKITLTTFQDVLRSFDVEFHVPTLDVDDESKDDGSQPEEGQLKTAECEEAPDSKKMEITDDNSKTCHEEGPTGKQVDVQDPEMTEKDVWFKFPAFSSPSKTVTHMERDSGQSVEQPGDNSESEHADETSATLSIRSSDAFADDSSEHASEQTVSSLFSPTKVKVKYAEPIPAGAGNITAKIVTSTARTELISMEPDLPEKVNISFSSESSSMDTVKEDSIRLITPNIHTIPDTQHAKIFTDLESHTFHTKPVEKVIIKTTSTSRSEHDSITTQKEGTVVEKQIIKKLSGASGETIEKVVITQKTSSREADSEMAFSGAATESPKKTRDTARSDRMQSFDSKQPLSEGTVVKTSVTKETRVKKNTGKKHHKK